jgi:Ca2+-binding RTX toxin-like protein
MTTLKRLQWLLLSGVVWGIATAPRIAEAQTRTHHDVLLQFNDPRGFITVTVGGQAANLTVKRSFLSLSSPDVNCSASVCPFTVNYLAVAIQNFTQALTINGDPGSFSVQDPWVVIHGPVAVNKNATQVIIPAGTPAELNANLSGGTSSHSITPGTRRQTSGTLSDIVIRLDPQRQIASIDGVFDFTISAMGATVQASARFTSSNLSAFDNNPPVANAGPDLTVTCPGVVTLDGSASTDPQNNITDYFWDAGNQGRVTTRSPRAQLRFGAGVHPVTLAVRDFYDSTTTDTMVVTVVDPPPTFTFVPPDVTSATCGPVNIGTARASSPCEPITVTSNAPARFPYGLTVVTWRGTTPSGKSITATQRVVVIPGDDPTCCPAGSTIIRGTSNNDTLNGTPGRDCILAFGGQDTINGGGGDDVISAGEGDDIVHAGSGNDVVSGGGGQDQMFGEDGNDILFGGTGDDVLDGAAGNDELHGGDGQDRLTCGVGDDRAFGDAGDDTLLGQDGNDFLDGGLNNNHCNGGNGVDIIMSCIADDGVDQIPGGVGADNFDVCQCAPANKCVDCTSVVQACTATAGCRAILRCVNSLSACHQPNECASTCENGFPQDAIQQAGITASCLGGC